MRRSLIVLALYPLIAHSTTASVRLTGSAEQIAINDHRVPAGELRDGIPGHAGRAQWSNAMRCSPITIAACATLAPNVAAQTMNCPATSAALQRVARDFWAGYNRRDFAGLDRILDDELLFVGVYGVPQTKAEFIADVRALGAAMSSQSDERMDDLRTIVVGNTAIVSFKKRWTIGFASAAVTVSALSRFTETLTCRDGRWRVLGYQETFLPNATRSPDTAAVSHYGDYVSRYRFGADGTGGEITVTRNGDKLFEAWGRDQPIELLPGKHDTFFVRGFPWHERFVRDERGRVVGIHYTFEDGEKEAKRIP